MLDMSLKRRQIWFEVWGVVYPVAEIFDSSRKISDFPGQKV